AHGSVSRGYIGVLIGEVDDAMAKSLGLERPRGIIVQDLVEGGAAEDADIRVGDVILKIDGREVNQTNQLQSYVATKTAGTDVTLTLFRDGKEIERTVTLKSRESDTKAEPIVDKTNEKKNESSTSSATFDDIGLTVRNLTKQEKDKFKTENGVMISSVKPYGKAFDQKLIQGLVIVEADKKKVNNVNDLKEIFEEKKGSAVLLKLQDAEGVTLFRGIEIPE